MGSYMSLTLKETHKCKIIIRRDGKDKKVDVDVETGRALTELTRCHHTLKAAHSPVRWSGHSAFAVHEVS